ncbi:MAG: hypothetical protein J7501_14080 [Bdellovibrio sp.]|nr:hypothetical protein [Bdellovibrio sp.]
MKCSVFTVLATVMSLHVSYKEFQTEHFLTRYVGLIHDYGLLNAISQDPAARSAMLQASQELKKYLFTSEKKEDLALSK